MIGKIFMESLKHMLMANPSMGACRAIMILCHDVPLEGQRSPWSIVTWHD